MLGSAVTLGMLPTRFGNTGERRRCGFAGIICKGDIAKGYNTDQALVPVDHREASNLHIGHAGGNLIQLLIVEAVADVQAHDIAHWRVRASTFSHSSNGDVTIGNHADKAIVLADRKRASVNPRHHLSRVPDRLIRSGNLDVLRHCFSD